MRVINPATGQVIREYREHSDEDIDRLVRQSAEAFSEWRTRSMEDRGVFFRRLGGILRVSKSGFARTMVEEMGKTIGSAEAEIEKCAVTCDAFADHAQRLLRPEDAPSDATRSYIRYDPLGTVLAIMPWNFPFWQVFRFAVPGLMAGNVGLLKHASNVPGCALAIEQVFKDAGFPEGALAALLISGKSAENLIAHPLIKAVTLTGSEQAGISVAAAAGKALKKTVLELGGSDPFIILKDVDIEATADAAANARCINSGQSCIAAKRFIVEESIADDFEQAFTDRMKRMRIGDPMDRRTEVGPLARQDLVDALHEQVEQSIRQGAKLTTGGNRIDREGFYYEPTVLVNVRPGMVAFDEETFGPVAAVTRAKDPGDAVRLANESRYGLGASIWTNDTDLAEKLAPDIEAGCVFINGAVKSDPRLPFGGVKHSGYGRELAEVGIREFVNIKTVWIRESR